MSMNVSVSIERTVTDFVVKVFLFSGTVYFHSGTDRYRAPIFVIVTMDIGTVADFCHRYLCPAIGTVRV